MNLLRKHSELGPFIPALPQGMRFLPIIKTQSFERKLDLLRVVKDCEGAAMTFTSMLCKSCKVDDDDELDKFETLADLWSIVDNSERD